MSTIEEIVSRTTIPEEERAVIVHALMVREDEIADKLRFAGTQLGALPEFVAEALVEVGLGTQPSEQERDLIRQNFMARMQQLREQYGQG